MCGKEVCERWCVTKRCVEEGVCDKDGVWKMVCERGCVTKMCDEDGVRCVTRMGDKDGVRQR